MNLIFGEISRKRARPSQCSSTSHVCTCVCVCGGESTCNRGSFCPLDPPTSPFRSAIAKLNSVAVLLAEAEFRNFEFGFFPMHCTLCKYKYANTLPLLIESRSCRPLGLSEKRREDEVEWNVINGSRSRCFIAQKWRFTRSARLLSSANGVERDEYWADACKEKEKEAVSTPSNSNAESIGFHSRRRYAAISAFLPAFTWPLII